MQLSEDFSETAADFEAMGISRPVPMDYDDDPEAWVTRDEFNRRKRQKLLESAVKNGLYEREHLDSMAINRVLLNNRGFTHLAASAAAARRRSSVRFTVDGRPMDEAAQAQEQAVLKTDRERDGVSDRSNTDHTSLHIPTVSTPHCGGIDWLSGTIYGDVEPRYYNVIGDMLATRNQLQTTRDREAVAFIGKHCGVVLRHGSGSGFNHMPLVWQSRGIEFKLGADRRKADGSVSSLPLMFVEIPGSALLVLGELECLSYVQQVLDALGIDATKIRVRRIDVCVDMVGAYRDRFENTFLTKAWVTRSNAVKPNYNASGKFTGFEVKGGVCSVTVYDKTEEMRLKKPHLVPAMIEHRWGGECPEEAWRVEFRLRPGKSHSMEFRSLDAVLGGLRLLCEWACCSWFRIVQKRHKNHSERTKVTELWAEVIAAFGGWATGGQPLRKRVVCAYDPTRVAKVGIGCLAKALALGGVDPDRLSIDECMETLFAITLQGEKGRGLEGTTARERRENFGVIKRMMTCRFWELFEAMPH